MCEGVRLILDPREPADRLDQPVRYLKHMPLAIIVRPLAVQVDDLNVEGLPPGCICVKPKPRSSNTDIQLPEPTRVKGTTTSKITVKIKKAFPLGDAACVSDYWVQGCSYKDACVITDFMPPWDGPLTRSAVLVMTTRYKGGPPALKAMRRLCAEEDEEARARIEEKFMAATQMSDDLRAELARLRILAWHTQNHFRPLFEKYGIATPETSQPLTWREIKLRELADALPAPTQRRTRAGTSRP
jgi:hypothetical protein